MEKVLDVFGTKFNTLNNVRDGIIRGNWNVESRVTHAIVVSIDKFTE